MKCSIGEESTFKVWTVDDAWFDGLEKEPSISFEIGLENIETFSSFKQKVSSREAYNEGFAPVGLDSDFEYLKTLVNMCSERRMQLILCSFEYFKENFNEIDIPSNVVLLDVAYPKYNDVSIRETYGINLIVELLKRNKPQAEICFVTSLGQYKIEKILGTNGWQIRKLKTLLKSVLEDSKNSILLSALNSLFDSLNLINYNEVLKIFAQNLTRSHKDKFAHPINSDIYIPSDFLFKNKFINDEESFKSLYYYDKNTTTGKGDREISLKVFIAHLEYSSIVVNSTDLDQIIKLPVQPGILLVMWLTRFIHSLNYPSISQITIQSTFNQCCIEIPLDKNKAYTFCEATHTGGGTLTKCLQGLIACKKDIFRENIDESSFLEVSNKWIYPKCLPHSKSEIYARLLEYEFDLEKSILILSWYYQIPNRLISTGRYFE